MKTLLMILLLVSSGSLAADAAQISIYHKNCNLLAEFDPILQWRKIEPADVQALGYHLIDRTSASAGGDYISLEDFGTLAGYLNGKVVGGELAHLYAYSNGVLSRHLAEISNHCRAKGVPFGVRTECPKDTTRVILRSLPKCIVDPLD